MHSCICDAFLSINDLFRACLFGFFLYQLLKFLVIFSCQVWVSFLHELIKAQDTTALAEFLKGTFRLHLAEHIPAQVRLPLVQGVRTLEPGPGLSGLYDLSIFCNVNTISVEALCWVRQDD